MSCQVCHTEDNPDQLLLCDNCDAGYHTYCLSPPLEQVPEDDWYCSYCIETSSQRINVGN